MTTSKRKAVINVSGGVDSAAVLIRAVQSELYTEIHPFFVHYGHKSAKHELGAAENTVYFAQQQGWPVKDLCVRVLPLNDVALVSAITGQPDADDEADDMDQVYIPGRNIYLITAAAVFALEVGALDILLGFHAWPDLDGQQHGDQSRLFLAAMNTLLLSALDLRPGQSVPNLIAPFHDDPKSVLLARVQEAGLDPKHLWTCYRPTSEGKPCNLCHACIGYLEASLDV